MINLPPFPKDTGPVWKGMTLREIEMRRTLVQARMEIQKFKLTANVEAMKTRAPLFGGSNSLFSRLSGAFTMAEYAFVAVRLFRMVSPLFRKKK